MCIRNKKRPKKSYAKLGRNATEAAACVLLSTGALDIRDHLADPLLAPAAPVTAVHVNAATVTLASATNMSKSSQLLQQNNARTEIFQRWKTNHNN